MGAVLIEHSVTIYGSEGDSLTITPHEDGLFRITYSDGDTLPIEMVLSREMTEAIGSTIPAIIQHNL